MLDHTRRIAAIIPVIGFYLQPAVGGRVLPFRFWRRLVDIENVVAIKVAPFNRYATIDVARAVAESGRLQPPVLYTGNDDSIVVDLLSRFSFGRSSEMIEDNATEEGSGSVRIVGGLLGQFGVWTERAVALFDEIKATSTQPQIPTRIVALASEWTDANGAVFDASNGFAGVIPGIHEVLRRAGLMDSTVCLDRRLELSRGQKEEIDRVVAAYPHLTDAPFVANNLNRWLLS